MTRGQIVAITNDGVKTSIEFNGSMYLDWYGKGIVNTLKSDMDLDGYKKFVEDFNATNFQYNERLFYDVEEVCLDMTKDDYFRVWFSDYLYIKNISDNNQTIVCQDGREIELNPQGYCVLYFGEFDDEDASEYDVLYKGTVNTNARFLRICKEAGWEISEDDEFFTLSKYSPAGEDFSIYVSKTTPCKDVEKAYRDFNPDEHAIQWIQSMNTCGGVPASVRELIDDAEAIEKMLGDLSDELNPKGRI